jgi:hypothetical protein
VSEATELWERLSVALEASDPAIGRSTMMGHPCLRLDGAFVAANDPRSGALIVKLDADAVSARVASGAGRAFAPAGKVFKQWLAIDTVDEGVWREAIGEALAFARSD